MSFTDGLLLGACGAWLLSSWARFLSDEIGSWRRRQHATDLFRGWEQSAACAVEKLTEAEKSRIRAGLYR